MIDEGLSWGECARVEPELMATARSRFASHEHHVLATIRPDGSPRVTGTNVLITDEILWIGSMPGSPRTADLRRDPRCALHSNPSNSELPEDEGDVRLDLLAREIEPATAAKLLEQQRQGREAAAGDCFELLVRSVDVVTVVADELIVRRWTPATGTFVIRRR